jgi:hypothetical protein
MSCIRMRCLDARLFVSRSHLLSHLTGHSVVRRDYPSCGRNGYTSLIPRVRVPQHVSRHVARHVVDYFTYATSPGALAPRAARHTAHRRLLRICHAFGCLGTSRGSSRGSSCRSSSTTSPTPRVRVPRHVARLVVDYFTCTARPGASAPRAARHAARCRLLRLRHTSGCLGTSRGLLLTVKIHQPRHEFTFGVGISFIPYPLVLTPVV